MFGFRMSHKGISRSGRRAIESVGAMLTAHPLDQHRPAKSIHLGSVEQWQDFGRANPLERTPRRDYEFFGFAPHEALGSQYSGNRVSIPELARIVRHERDMDFECNLTDIEGLGASKAPLAELADMDDFAHKRCAPYIKDISLAAMNQSLSHGEIRVIHSPGSDFFVRHSWDRRLFLANSGGSHHLCSGRYVAARLNASVPLRAKLHRYDFDQSALADVLRSYAFGVIGSTSEVKHAFFEAMQQAKVRFYWLRLPRPFDSVRGVIFPLEDERSQYAFDLLRTSGMFDLGEYLKALAAGRPDT